MHGQTTLELHVCLMVQIVSTLLTGHYRANHIFIYYMQRNTRSAFLFELISQIYKTLFSVYYCKCELQTTAQVAIKNGSFEAMSTVRCGRIIHTTSRPHHYRRHHFKGAVLNC